MQYAEVDIYPASSLTITIKARNRNGKVLKDRRTDTPPPPQPSPRRAPPPHPHPPIFPSYVHIKQRSSSYSSYFPSFCRNRQASWTGWEGTFFFLQFQMHHHMHRIQKCFRRHITRRNEAPTWLKRLSSRSVVPIMLVFIL